MPRWLTREAAVVVGSSVLIDAAFQRGQFVPVRIVKEHFLREAARKHPAAARWLRDWTALTRRATWRNWVDVNRDYPGTDAVRTSSGRTVGVFNVRRNEFRLIAAVHFNRQIVFTLRFLSHAEYGKSRWSDEL